MVCGKLNVFTQWTYRNILMRNTGESKMFKYVIGKTTKGEMAKSIATISSELVGLYREKI